MSVPPRSASNIVDSVMIDIDSSVVKSIDSEIATALRAAIFIPLRTENSNKPIREIGGTAKTVVAILFWFYVGAKIHSV